MAKCPESIEELEELEKQLPFCWETLRKQANAKIDSGTAYSKNEAARQLAKETGRPFGTIRDALKEQYHKPCDPPTLCETKAQAASEDKEDEDNPCCWNCYHSDVDRQICWKHRSDTLVMDERCEDWLSHYETEEIIEEQPSCSIPQVHVAQNSGENEWYTPPEFIEAARAVMGGIDCDPASSEIANKAVKAEKFFTAAQDGRDKDWGPRVWMNPPYAQPLIAEFSDGMASRFESGQVKEACVLVNNATETGWFQRMMSVAAAVAFIKSRVRFLDPEGNRSGAPLQGQCVLYFGENRENFYNEFSRFGIVLYHASV